MSRLARFDGLLLVVLSQVHALTTGAHALPTAFAHWFFHLAFPHFWGFFVLLLSAAYSLFERKATATPLGLGGSRNAKHC